jgi:hypothetical protein
MVLMTSDTEESSLDEKRYYNARLYHLNVKKNVTIRDGPPTMFKQNHYVFLPKMLHVPLSQTVIK